MQRYVFIVMFLTLFAQPAGGPPAHGAVVAPETAHEAGDHLPATSPPLPSAPDLQAIAPSGPDALLAEAPRISPDEICRTIEEAAADNALPVAFFTRLIWQESRFDQRAISRAGAQGIAQFMPGTALWRGLANPFHAIQALQESANWLSELRKQYGNLGLAAAAYNAGPGRVQKWLAGRASLPGETRAYVRSITGRTADEWAAPEPPNWDGPGIPHGVPCRELRTLVAATKEQPPRPVAPAPHPAWRPWGVQLAGNWSERTALSQYQKLQKKFDAVLGDRRPVVFRVRAGARAPRHLVRVAENTREAAEKLCAKLRSAGGNCLVSKNPGAAAMVN